MTSTGWNPWKMTAIGLGLVVVTALLTGVVVAKRSGYEGTQNGATAVVAPSLGLPSQAVIAIRATSTRQRRTGAWAPARAA